MRLTSEPKNTHGEGQEVPKFRYLVERVVVLHEGSVLRMEKIYAR